MNSSLADRARFISEAMMANMVASAARRRGARDEHQHGHHGELDQRRRDGGVDKAKVRGLSPSHSLTP